MNSLRARLFAALSAFILVTGLVAGALAFHWAFEEAIELQDAILTQVSRLAASTHTTTEIPAEGGIDGEDRVTIEELGQPPAQAPGTPVLAPLPRDLPNGLQTLWRGGETWRVLVRGRPDGSRLAVGQPTETRDEIARDSALRAALPLAVLIPCLLAIVGLVIRSSFKPVADLARSLDVKTADHLDHLPPDGLPDELLPFIASINRLLDRIRAMFDRQRRFIAAAAHELRSPITAMSLQAENLAHADMPLETAARLATLRTGIRRTAHLLEQLLASARHDRDSDAPLPVTAFDAVVKGVLGDLAPDAHRENIDLGLTTIEPAAVKADATALAVLVRNLVDNALRHTPAGGQIDVGLVRDGPRVVLRIEDTGPGIPDAEIARILEPFVRGSRPGGDGSGLGLSIVHGIVERHGGSIVLANRRGRSGLAVTVTFAAADDR